MHYERPLFGIVACFVFLVGCGSGGDSNQGSSSLETSFTHTLSNADHTVENYADSDDPAGDAADYNTRETNDLDHMDGLWEQMHSECDNFTECPSGGGMSGDPNGNCMPNGHMMNADQMNQLHDTIASARRELEDYWTSCGESFDPATCESRRQQHTDAMHGMLSQMEDDTSQWWSQEDGHWGSCADHHNGGPMN